MTSSIDIYNMYHSNCLKWVRQTYNFSTQNHCNIHFTFSSFTTLYPCHDVLLCITCCNNSTAAKTAATENTLLSQQSWLLKCVAIELRTLAVNRQRSHTQRLITLLLDDNPNPAHKSKLLLVCFVSFSTNIGM